MSTKPTAAHKIVKRSNTVLILTSIICLLAVAFLVAISSGPYWYAQLTGPIEMTTEEIAALDGSTRLYNRVVSGEDMKDTFYYEETVNEYGRQMSIDAYFGALELDDDLWILVREPTEINRRQEDYVGTLQPITDDIAQEVAELAADEMRIEFLPVMLDTTRDETLWYVGTVGLVLLTLFSIWGIFAYIRRSNDPFTHPIFKSLGRFGDIEHIAQQVESDRILGESKIGNLIYTERFVITQGAINFDVMPYSEIVWVYKMVQKGRYGIKSYQARICDSTGKEWSVAGKEQQVDAMLNATAARAPWSAKGYSDQIKNLWNTDRQAFVSEIAVRHEAFKK